MTTPSAPALDDLARGLAEELGEATMTRADDLTSYARAGSVFARVSSNVLEVRLPEDIADAASRSLDTVAIAVETGWIRFTPSTDERHVTDRAEAWFRTAWRHALQA